MNILLFCIQAILPIGILTGVGYGLFKTNFLNENFNEKGSKFLFKFCFPLSLFYQIYSSDSEIIFDPKLAGFIILAYSMILVLLLILMPRFIKSEKRLGAFIQGASRGNLLILGVPLAQNLFGPEGVEPIMTILPTTVIMYNVSSGLLLSYYQRKLQVARQEKQVNLWLQTLKNPLIIGSFLGMLAHAVQLPLPNFLIKSIADIAVIATPLAFIILGGQLSYIKKFRFNLALLFAILIKLIIGPMIVLGIAIMLGFSKVEVGTLFVIFASPTAVASYIMARNMESDADFAAQIVFMTTIFSVFSLMLIFFILKIFAFI